MGAKNHGDERAWTLLRWLGGKDPITNEFGVIKRWAIDYGLGTFSKELAKDPDVVEAWKQWKDLDIYNTQFERGVYLKAMKQLWFDQWSQSLVTEAQNAIIGTKTVGEVITALYDMVVTLRKEYPTV